MNKLLFILLSVTALNASAAQTDYFIWSHDHLCQEQKYNDAMQSWKDLTSTFAKKQAASLTEFYNSKDCDTAREKKAQDDARAQLPGVSIGMTKLQVINETNWGNPQSINTTVTNKVTHEQWVYPNYNYLYFANGRVVSIQTHR